MNNFMLKIKRPGWLLVPWLLIGLLAGGVSCKKEPVATKPADVDYYTCTMHPSVHSQDPHGKCPICSMELVPVLKRGITGTNLTNGEFTVPVKRQQQFGVTHATIQRQPFTRTIRATGLVAADEQRHWDYVARNEGYVEALSVFSKGEAVTKDAPLLTFYSPDLLAAQNELLNLLKARDEAKNRGSRTAQENAERLVEAARERLRHANLTDGQIAELEKNRAPSATLTLRSPFQGVVQDLGVEQGRHVVAGDSLVGIADLSVVWVWAQFYQDDLPMLKAGLPITITTSSYPGEKFNGKISVVDPFINDSLRTGRVRIDVENTDLKLRPDMYVDADLTLNMGEGAAVPFDAVLPTGQHNIVFVDKGRGSLEPRFVELGRKYGDFYEVKDGLKEGERVVTSANFLMDAEAKVQGALKSW